MLRQRPMFIPTWLLILIVVMLVSVFLPSIWRELTALAFLLFALLVLISIPTTYYFVFRKDYQTALVVAIPFAAAMFWFFGTETLKAIRTSFWLHDARVRAAATPEAVINLRRQFADDLGVGGKLFNFTTASNTSLLGLLTSTPTERRGRATSSDKKRSPTSVPSFRRLTPESTRRFSIPALVGCSPIALSLKGSPTDFLHETRAMKPDTRMPRRASYSRRSSFGWLKSQHISF